MDNEAQQRERVIERVKKLLALSTSPNENEAAAAAEKAQALLAEYNLSIADLKTGEKKEDEVYFDEDAEMTDSRPWRRQLAAMTAKMFFCTHFFMFHYFDNPRNKVGYKRRDQHIFVGSRGNAEVARLMFEYFNSTIERLAREAGRNEARRRSSFENSFKHAAANRLCWRIKERIDAAARGDIKGSDGRNLPALVGLLEGSQARNRAAIDERLSDVKSIALRPDGAGRNEKGMRAGDEAGKKIGLDQQVQTSPNVPRLSK